MFRTFMGPVEDTSPRGLAAPRDSPGHFRQLQERRGPPPVKKVPFGIAQIGKAFRNEITPGNFTFRTREFEQMEIEFFVPPGDRRLNGWSAGSTVPLRLVR